MDAPEHGMPRTGWRYDDLEMFARGTAVRRTYLMRRAPYPIWSFMHRGFVNPWCRASVTVNPSKNVSRAQQLARFCVADSSAELVTGPTLRAP